MLRNKSQAACTKASQISEVHHSRSKKGSINLHKNKQSSNTERKNNDISMLSMQSHKNSVLQSMKNLKLGANRMNGQANLNDTAKSSAMSARILKQIVNYTNSQDQTAHVKLDIKLEEYRPSKSNGTCTIHHKNAKGKVVEQFSPLPLKAPDAVANSSTTYIVGDFSQILQGMSIEPNQQSSAKHAEKVKNEPPHAQQVQQLKHLSPQQLQKTKQSLILDIEHTNAILDEHYLTVYKQLLPLWDTLILLQSENQSSQTRVKGLSHKLHQLVEESSRYKDKLFILNRDYVMNKKKKDYLLQNGKEAVLQQAERLHLELRNKLTSRADYEHVVMFNIKVVLPAGAMAAAIGNEGSVNIRNTGITKVYQQMFESQGAKKFALIAKKELTHLSAYDAKIIQQFLKKIQDLQSSYLKIDKTASSVPQPHPSLSTHEYMRILEELVETIQELALQSNKVQATVVQFKTSQQENQAMIASTTQKIHEHVKKVSVKVSQEYRMTEGKVYDFQTMLQRKYDEDFHKYQQLVEKRQINIRKLNAIQNRLSGGDTRTSCGRQEPGSEGKLVVDDLNDNQ